MMKYLKNYDELFECQLLFSLTETNDVLKRIVNELNWKKDFKFHKLYQDSFTTYGVYLKNYSAIYDDIGSISFRVKNIYDDKIPYKEIHIEIFKNFQGLGLAPKLIKACAKKFNDYQGNIRFVKGRIINDKLTDILEKMKNDSEVNVIDTEYYYEIIIR